MPIDDHLLRDENILASARAAQGGNLYATNKRIIWYKKSISRENVDSLYYSHIVSASYESRFHIGLVIGGVLLLVLGLFMVPQGYFGLFGIFFTILGILLALYGILKRPKWYKLTSPGLSKEQQKRWRTDRADEDAKTLARFVQDQIARRETSYESRAYVPSTSMPPIPPPPPLITKEIIREEVMVRCKYCESLIPQGATFCVNCGAKM